MGTKFLLFLLPLSYFTLVKCVVDPPPSIMSVDKHANDIPDEEANSIGPPAFGPFGLATPQFDVHGRGNGVPNLRIFFPRPPAISSPKETSEPSSTIVSTIETSSIAPEQAFETTTNSGPIGPPITGLLNDRRSKTIREKDLLSQPNFQRPLGEEVNPSPLVLELRRSDEELASAALQPGDIHRAISANSDRVEPDENQSVDNIFRVVSDAENAFTKQSVVATQDEGQAPEFTVMPEASTLDSVTVLHRGESITRRKVKVPLSRVQLNTEQENGDMRNLDNLRRITFRIDFAPPKSSNGTTQKRRLGRFRRRHL